MFPDENHAPQRVQLSGWVQAINQGMKGEADPEQSGLNLPRAHDDVASQGGDAIAGLRSRTLPQERHHHVPGLDHGQEAKPPFVAIAIILGSLVDGGLGKCGDGGWRSLRGG